MIKTKTEELIGSMSRFDREAFAKYLCSPYFNVNSEVGKLFHVLWPDPSIIRSRTRVFSILFPRRTYDDKYFRYLISDINRHLTRFFVLKHLEDDPLKVALITGNALAERDCEKSYYALHSDFSSRTPYRDASWHLAQALHEEGFINYESQKQIRKKSPDLSGVLVQLDAFYLTKKLQLACEAANIEIVLGKKTKIELIEEVRSLAAGTTFREHPVLKIYYHIYQLLTSVDPEPHFHVVKQLLTENADVVSPLELNDMYQYLKNFCVGRINRGFPEYLSTLFEIYQSIISNPSLMRLGYFSPWEYKNIVSISLRLGKTEWCRLFIAEFISHLDPRERDNALAFNTAYFLFSVKDYRKAIRKLQEVELKDVFYQLDARAIILKCYYELDDQESYYYHASAFRLFLLRNRNVSDYQKNIYRNLIRFLTAILRAGVNRKKLQKIADDMELEKNVADLNWLRQKVRELM